MENDKSRAAKLILGERPEALLRENEERRELRNAYIEAALEMPKAAVAEALMQAGKDMAKRDSEPSGLDALDMAMAMQKPNQEIIKLLLEAGANPAMRGVEPSEMSPLHAMIEMESRKTNSEVIKLLLEAGETPVAEEPDALAGAQGDAPLPDENRVAANLRERRAIIEGMRKPEAGEPKPGSK